METQTFLHSEMSKDRTDCPEKRRGQPYPPELRHKLVPGADVVTGWLDHTVPPTVGFCKSMKSSQETKALSLVLPLMP